MKILSACPKGQSGQVVHLEMPRETLVPFGGAAPIDVFAVRVEDAAILALVLPSWNNKGKVALALRAGAALLADMIRKARKARAQKAVGKKPAEPARRERSSTVPPESKRDRAVVPPAPAARRERTTVPFEPARKERQSSLPKAPKEAAAAKKPARPRASSEPEIVVGEAKVGRETLAAIETSVGRETFAAIEASMGPRPSSEPEIAIGEAEVGRETLLAIEASAGRETLAAISAVLRPRPSSAPEIVIGEAEVGRETLAAIHDALPPSAPGPAPDAMRVELASISRESLLEVERLEAAQRGRPTVEEPLVTERRTLPFVDAPATLRRVMDARALSRDSGPPDVRTGVAEIDPDVLEQALQEDE